MISFAKYKDLDEHILVYKNCAASRFNDFYMTDNMIPAGTRIFKRNKQSNLRVFIDRDTRKYL